MGQKYPPPINMLNSEVLQSSQIGITNSGQAGFA